MGVFRQIFDPPVKPPPPKHAKTEKVQYLPAWQAHAWVLYHAAWPMLVHQGIVSLRGGRNLRATAAFFLYMIAFNVNAAHEVDMLSNLGMKYGFLDGDTHARDEIPAGAERKVWSALLSTSSLRPLMMTWLAYSRAKLPSSVLSWWTPLEIGVYPVVLDFWFYWYHRLLHEREGLWRFHRTHHLTKHPSVLLTLYADKVQEVFDIAGVPLLTWLTLRAVGFPMGFYETWLCHQYVVFTELFGHSGVRLWVTPPTTLTPLLRWFRAELTTEDHDLHHRKGWRKSQNYGKQTLLWDRLFGTAGERIELKDENVDWSKPGYLELGYPLF